jgi:hypothetical protein
MQGIAFGNSLIRHHRNSAFGAITIFCVTGQPRACNQLLVTRRAIAGRVRCRKTAANTLAKNRAIRSNSSKAPMRFLRDFRSYPLRGLRAAAILPRKIATNPLRLAGLQTIKRMIPLRQGGKTA